MYSVPADSSGSTTDATDLGALLYAADVEGYLAVGVAKSDSICSPAVTAAGHVGGHDYDDNAAAAVEVRAQ